eukprot:CAMPEP_0168595576 /NCGR_PEP_ID=MMETSP0420-20121227/9545_1 /TAXON_ID=498008 /ORGANISM="Pessonella sp." /LENGTH=226 /DNA_ID=CAMNT_0008632051 /DNA_START=257 /DNA_END=933 /DNA_ORIENTATION=+
MTLIISSSLALYDLDSSGAFSLLEGFLRFSAHTGGFVAAALSAKYVHIDTTHVINVLMLHRAVLIHVNNVNVVRHQRHNRVFARLRLMSRFRAVTMIHLVILAIVQILVIFSNNSLGWYENLILELVEIIWATTLVHLLRLRTFARYTVRPLSNNDDDDNAMPLRNISAQRKKQILQSIDSLDSPDERNKARAEAIEAGDLTDDGMLVVQLPPKVTLKKGEWKPSP